MKSPFAVLAAAVLGIAALSVPGSAGASPQAHPSTGRLLAGFADIITDPTHAQVFISEGSANKVAVVDSHGQLIRDIPGLPAASGMVLSPDKSTVFIALHDGDAIAAIDTSTLEATQIATGGATCPNQVAVTAGSLWFSYGCATSDDGNLGEIDLATIDVHLGLIDSGYVGGPPILTADPQHLDGALFVGQPGPTTGDLYLYDVTGGSAPTAIVRNHRIAGANLQDMAVSPTGDQLLVAAESNSVARRFSTSDLTPISGYVTGAGPGAVAYRPDGMVAIGRGLQSPNLEIFKPGYQGRFRTYELGGQSRSLQPRGMAFGNTQLFAVTGRFVGQDLALHVLLPKHATTLSIRTDRAYYEYDDGAKITVHLGYTVTNRVVAISMTPYGGATRVVKHARVDAAGNLSVVAPVFKNSTFTVTYAGDAESDPATRQIVRRVRARVTNTLRGWYGQAGGFHLYHVDDDPVLTTTVTPHVPGTCVYFRGQYFVNGHWITGWKTGCGHLDSRSQQYVRLVGTHVVGEEVRMRAEWTGGPANLAAVGPWQNARFTGAGKAREGVMAPSTRHGVSISEAKGILADAVAP